MVFSTYIIMLLFDAIRTGRIDIVQNLLSFEAEHGQSDNAHRNILHTALQFTPSNNIVDMVKILIEAGADVNALNNSGATTLHFTLKKYANNNNLLADIVQMLIVAAANVNALDHLGNSPLQTAIKYANNNNDLRGIVQMLIAAGANVNALDHLGDSPLQTAIKYANNNNGFRGIVQMLIVAGANVNATDFLGRSPVNHMVRMHDLVLLQVLIAAGADVTVVDANGHTLLCTAVRNATVDIVRAILDANAHIIDDRGNVAWTPLMYAASADNRDVMNLLIQRGADWTLTENTAGFDRTALDLTPDAASHNFLVNLIRQLRRVSAG